MNFFGVYAFLLLLFTFIYTFSGFLGILSIWAAYFEPPQSGTEVPEF
jgi:low temperature requirement protein LtrA